VSQEDDVKPRILHSKSEAAALLGISLRSLDYMISRGEIKTVKLCKKRRMVPRAEIQRIALGAR
jgi:excisionase family DNA binding protein